MTNKNNVCKKCGCTDDKACIGGCYWVDEEKTLCSQCDAKFKQQNQVAIETLNKLILRLNKTDATPDSNKHFILGIGLAKNHIRFEINKLIRELKGTA